LNALGDTIVVAVVDDGIMAAHEDFSTKIYGRILMKYLATVSMTIITVM